MFVHFAGGRKRKRRKEMKNLKKGHQNKLWESTGWIGAVLVVFGYSLNANHLVSCWPVWVLGNGMITAYSYHKKAYSTMVMSLVILIMNIYGWISWS